MSVANRTEPRSFRFRAASLLVAICGVGVGISVMVSARLGVAPADVLATGGAKQLDIGVGTMGWISGAIFTLLALAVRRPPSWGTLIGGVLVGQVVNLVIDRIPDPDVLVARIPMMFVGLALLYISISIGVSTTLGTGPMELLMLGLVDKGVSVQVARWGIEATTVTIGFLLGGQIGVGTIIFVVCTGPVLARTLPPVARFMGTTLVRDTAALDA
ncbi:MAG: YczE/YyaS/YitT family protein [Ilumatobacteraceae bacterium]